MNLLLAVNIDETTKKIKSSGPIKIGDNLLFDLANQLLDSKDEKFLLSDADTVPGKLLDKLTIGEGLTSAIFDNNPHGLALLLESDGKVKVDAAGTLDYLINQLTEGTNVTIAKVDGRLQISVNNIGDDNVQSDWAETRTNDDSFIKNKPNIPSDLSDLTDTNDSLGKVKVDGTGILDYLENQIQGDIDGSVNITKDTSIPGDPILIVTANPRIFAVNGDGSASNNLMDKLEAGDNVTIEPSPNQPPDGLTSFKVRINATGGGSSLPATGTMLFYDGTNWVASGHRFGYEENNDVFWWGDYNEENPFVKMQMPDQHGNYNLRLGAGWYGDKMVFGLPVMYSDPLRQMEGDVYFNGNTNKIRYYDGTNWIDINTSSDSSQVILNNYTGAENDTANDRLTKIITLEPNSVYHFDINIFGRLIGGESNQEVVDISAITAPTQETRFIGFTNILTNSFTVNCSPGDGENRIGLLMKGVHTNYSDWLDSLPSNGVILPPAMANISEAPSINKAKLVYNGNGNEFTVYGLQPNTDYTILYLEYNNSLNPQYLFSGGLANPRKATTAAGANVFTYTIATVEISGNNVTLEEGSYEYEKSNIEPYKCLKCTGIISTGAAPNISNIIYTGINDVQDNSYIKLVKK